MIPKYATTFFAAAALTVAGLIGASAIEPEEAAAQTMLNTVTITGCTVALEAMERKVLDLHNARRTGKGLKKLCVHPALQRAAEAHSKDTI